MCLYRPGVPDRAKRLRIPVDCSNPSARTICKKNQYGLIQHSNNNKMLTFPRFPLLQLYPSLCTTQWDHLKTGRIIHRPHWIINEKVTRTANKDGDICISLRGFPENWIRWNRVHCHQKVNNQLADTHSRVMCDYVSFWWFAPPPFEDQFEPKDDDRVRRPFDRRRHEQTFEFGARPSFQPE